MQSYTQSLLILGRLTGETCDSKSNIIHTFHFCKPLLMESPVPYILVWVPEQLDTLQGQIMLYCAINCILAPLHYSTLNRALWNLTCWHTRFINVLRHTSAQLLRYQCNCAPYWHRNRSDATANSHQTDWDYCRGLYSGCSKLGTHTLQIAQIV